MKGIDQVAMLSCGVALFLFALGLIAYLARKDKSFGGAIALLPVAVIMIGFASIKSAKIGEGGIEFDKQTALEFSSKPEVASTKAAFDRELTAVEKARSERPTERLSKPATEALRAVSSQLEAKKDISADSRVILARTQLLLGETKEATANLRTIMEANPRLISDPKLRQLANPVAKPATP